MENKEQKIQKIVVSILIIKNKTTDGSTIFSAQCLEYDVVAQGKTLPEAQKMIYHVLLAEIFLDLENNIKPFSSYKKPPKEFQKLFKSAKSLENSLTPPGAISPDKIHNFPSLEIKEWKICEFDHPFIPEEMRKTLAQLRRP
ncbi:MAG: hypothetical protein PHD51_03305 [Patescibacteria group bacterium]|nr:hypothetical protein [Patescibacteria group bacterium]MDD5490994.1 hypothetical protein [Patescibacteria group bacterium]